MKGQEFSLKPFAPQVAFEITGRVLRRNNSIAISYRLTGPLVELDIPIASSGSGRLHRLWENTCFEFFLASSMNSPRYWEFNLSPAGNWNVYRFSDYRRNMQEETDFKFLPLLIGNHSECSLSLSMECCLDEIVCKNDLLTVGISAVLKSRSGELTYWALRHPASPADFHNRESFILQL